MRKKTVHFHRVSGFLLMDACCFDGGLGAQYFFGLNAGLRMMVTTADTHHTPQHGGGDRQPATEQ
jgi:hypothetical protein